MDFELRDLRGVSLATLTRFAEAIFGRGDRAPGWLERKLAREGMSRHLSIVAVRTGSPEHVPYNMLLGYLLLGHDPGEPVAHSAGFGVSPEARGRGIGRAMIDAAPARLARADLRVLRILAEPSNQGYFIRRGFQLRARRLTLMAQGTCPISQVDLELAAHPPRPWSPAPAPAHALELCAWRPGAWARTAPAAAATLDLLPGAWAHVSREGRALLVQRLLVSAPEDALAATDALIARTPAAMPLLLLGADPVSSITAALLQPDPPRAAKFQVAQRFAVMELDLPPR